MRSMTMPRFTAEASLYRTNGHYRTGRNSHAVNSSAQMISPIHPAREKIEVHGCAPGSYLVDNGDGTWDCWSNPDPWGGGGGGSGTSGVLFEGEPGGGGGGGLGTGTGDPAIEDPICR